MKVTGTMKQYIENHVNKLYQSKIDEIDKSYKDKQTELQNAITTIAKTANDTAFKLMNEYGYKCVRYGEDKHTVIDTQYINSVVPNNYEELEHRKAELKSCIAEDVNDVIVNMELGGDKETLDNMLAQIADKLNKE